jgi:antitoxin ParD1/3/4
VPHVSAPLPPFNAAARVSEKYPSLTLPVVLFDGSVPMGMNISLTPQLEEMIRRKVDSGLYNSASEVVRDALRLMDEKDLLRATKLDQLRQEIQEGLSSGPVTAWDREEIKRKGRAKRATKTGTAKA